MIKLDDIAKGDRWPFHKFRLWEEVRVSGKFVRRQIDLSADFSDLKYFARHEDNMEDLDDHAKDDINGDLTLDGSGDCHYEWDVSPETDKTGKYVGRLYGTRTDGRPWHAKVWFTFNITHPTRTGRTTS
jgi:hypothetical protein